MLGAWVRMDVAEWLDGTTAVGSDGQNRRIDVALMLSPGGKNGLASRKGVTRVTSLNVARITVRRKRAEAWRAFHVIP